MDKLNQLLSGNVLDFAAAFGAVTREAIHEAAASDCPVWLEGWVAPARAGYVVGDGEFIYEGRTRRFHFSGLPMRHGQGTRVSGTGTISQLRTLSDFSGAYLPRDAGPKRAGQRSGVVLCNEHGVIIDLFALNDDPLLDLPYDGLSVRLAAAPLRVVDSLPDP
jgi:hypothetical protein